MINHAKQLKITLTAVTLCLALTAVLTVTPVDSSQAAGRGCKNANIMPRKGTLKRAEKALLCLINKQRSAAGLSTYKRSKPLTTAASKHSRDMNRNRFFSSESPNGALPIDRAKKARYGTGSITFTVAENISFGTGIYSTPNSTFKSWISNRITRGNILSSDYKDIGIGIAYGKPVTTTPIRGATYTVMFGVKEVSQPVAPAQPMSVL